MRSPLPPFSLCGFAAVIAVFSLACSSSDPIEDGSGGAGGASSSTATQSATTTSGGATCDDLNLVCGDDEEAGCQGCALDGACKDLAEQCVSSPNDQCSALNDCYLDCVDAEGACFDACDAQFPDSHDVLEDLLLCIFCGQCQASCQVNPAACQ